MKFSADDRSNRFRERFPDAFSNESIRPAGSQCRRSLVQLRKAPLSVKHKEAVADPIENQVSIEAWRISVQRVYLVTVLRADPRIFAITREFSAEIVYRDATALLMEREVNGCKA